MISKLYLCRVFDVAFNEFLTRRSFESDLVRLCSSDFPKLLQKGFRVFIIEFDDYSMLDETSSLRSFYRRDYRRACRSANFILTHHSLPPKL